MNDFWQINFIVDLLIQNWLEYFKKILPKHMKELGYLFYTGSFLLATSFNTFFL